MKLQEQDIKEIYGETIYRMCGIIMKWSWTKLWWERTIVLYPEPGEIVMAYSTAELMREKTGMSVKVVKS